MLSSAMLREGSGILEGMQVCWTESGWRRLLGIWTRRMHRHAEQCTPCDGPRSMCLKRFVLYHDFEIDTKLQFQSIGGSLTNVGVVNGETYVQGRLGPRTVVPFSQKGGHVLFPTDERKFTIRYTYYTGNLGCNLFTSYFCTVVSIATVGSHPDSHKET